MNGQWLPPNRWDDSVHTFPARAWMQACCIVDLIDYISLMGHASSPTIFGTVSAQIANPARPIVWVNFDLLSGDSTACGWFGRSSLDMLLANQGNHAAVAALRHRREV
jgi:hypothetical protein